MMSRQAAAPIQNKKMPRYWDGTPNATFRMAAGTLGMASAFSFLMGWLNEFLPSLLKRVEEMPSDEVHDMKHVYCIIVPKSGTTPKTFAEADPNIETLNIQVQLTKTLAGVKCRPYNTPVHELTIPDKPDEKVRFMGEFPSAVRTNQLICNAPLISTGLHNGQETEAFLDTLQRCLAKQTYRDIVIPIEWDDQTADAPPLSSIILSAIREREVYLQREL